MITNDKSLYYQTLINGTNAILNKKQIESAVQHGQFTNITMVSGEKFIANANFGDLMFHLSQVPHKPEVNE